uniref:Uncharacterized protein n=1 Tax=Arundo donax TaxID=35708 RepID=A0A0A9CHH8_ARUDO
MVNGLHQDYYIDGSAPAVGHSAFLPRRPPPGSCRPCGPWTRWVRSCALSRATTARESRRRQI